LYLPSLYSEELGTVVIAVDTSCSISNREIDQFGAEVSAILEEFDTTAHVVYCDTDVQWTETFSQRDLPLKLHPKGGGGTDFRPPFEWVEDRQMEPCCLVYLTDLECSRFPEEPSYPVLWVVVGDYRQPVPFGEVLAMS
jgi:predicted metal-dependent peptidase